MKDNDCPRPPKELVINEVGGILGADVYVELIGPPLTPLHEMVLVLYELSTARHVVPLEGSLGNDGFFLMGNESRAGECVHLCGRREVLVFKKKFIISKVQVKVMINLYLVVIMATFTGSYFQSNRIRL